MARIKVGDTRLVRLYHDWLNSSYGDAFQRIVNEMRAGWHPKEQPIKFAEEMRNLVADRDDPEHRRVPGTVRIPGRLLKLLDIASSVVLGMPQRRAFVRLALAVSVMEKELVPLASSGTCSSICQSNLQIVVAASGGNHDVGLPPLQPSILKLLQTMQQQTRIEARSRFCSQEEREYVKLAVYPLPFGEVEVEFGSVFDVTKPVCEFLFSWLEHRQDVLKLVEGMDARLHEMISEETLDDVQLRMEAMLTPISKLICISLMNEGMTAPADPDAVKRMLVSGCKFVGNSAIILGDLTPAVEELCKEDVASATAPLTTAWLCTYSLMYKMCELQRRTKLVAVSTAMLQMRRLYNIWIEHWDERQWQLIEQEQALDACVGLWKNDREIWESLCPYGRNFANVVAAVSKVETGKTHLMEMDVIYSGALLGEYDCLKPHYPGTGDPAEKSISWVVMRMVETAFIYYRRGRHFVNGLTEDDEPRMFQLPVASRDAAERQVLVPTLVICRDMTRPACRVLRIWCKSKPYASPRRHKNRAGCEAMLRCFEANRYHDRCDVDVNLDTIVACLDDTRALGLLTDGVDVGPFLSDAVMDVHEAFQKQKSNDYGIEQKRLKPEPVELLTPSCSAEPKNEQCDP